MWIPIEGGFLHAARFDRIQFDGDACRAIRYGREASSCEFIATPAEVARTRARRTDPGARLEAERG